MFIEDQTDTELLFITHASVLIRWKESFLLTDPWDRGPAFETWLPMPPPSIHPAYLTGLARSVEKFAVLVSHAHGDHCDPTLLGQFPDWVPLVTANFTDNAVAATAKEVGLRDIRLVDSKPVSVGDFRICGFINPDFGPNDAYYAIRTPDALIVHANDYSWRGMPEPHQEAIRALAGDLPPERRIYMGQANTASGHPLTYIDYSAQERMEHLRIKVRTMYQNGLANTAMLGCAHYLPYAGYNAVFLDDDDGILGGGIAPFPSRLRALFPEVREPRVALIDMAPGDRFDFVKVQKNPVNRLMKPEALELATRNYYDANRDTASIYAMQRREDVDVDRLIPDLEAFLQTFDRYVRKAVAERGVFQTAIGKVFSIRIEDLNLSRAVRFGEGLVNDKHYTKRVTVRSSIIRAVIDRKLSFDALYTGRLGRFQRRPKDQYNYDIILLLDEFTYAYRYGDAA